jgi:hypothetical protein
MLLLACSSQPPPSSLASRRADSSATRAGEIYCGDARPEVWVPEDGARVTTRSLTLSGTAEPDTDVFVLIDGVVVGTARADAMGQWQLSSPELTMGRHTVWARLATVPTCPSEVHTFSVDATALAVAGGGFGGCEVPGRESPFTWLALLALVRAVTRLHRPGDRQS